MRSKVFWLSLVVVAVLMVSTVFPTTIGRRVVEEAGFPEVEQETRDVGEIPKIENGIVEIEQGEGGSGDRVLTHPEADLDRDGIDDSFETEIADAIASDHGGQIVTVFSQFSSAPTDDDVAIFEREGGILVSRLFTRGPRSFGFSGKIAYDKIADYVANNARIGYLEDFDAGPSLNMAYGTTQIGARGAYGAWASGYDGDSNSTIATVDTGIDDEHATLLGYGDKDFTKKIVGWHDYTDGTSNPEDKHGHGTACMSIAAGSGYDSADANTTKAVFFQFPSWSYQQQILGEGYPCNSAGTIVIDVYYTTTNSSAQIENVTLWNAGQTLENVNDWTYCAKVDPVENAWTTLRYSVSSPSTDFINFRVKFFVTSGSNTDNVWLALKVNVPYSNCGDGKSLFTGVAYNAKVYAAQIEPWNETDFETKFYTALDDIISNKTDYHINVVSLSMGLNEYDKTFDDIIYDMSEAGIVVVAAAGNSYNGTSLNTIKSPASACESLTVGAVSQFDNLTEYSSQGGRFTDNRYITYTKPDAVAPGGSAYLGGIYAADSNTADLDSAWYEKNITVGFNEIRANDTIVFGGTSASAPFVAGAANLIIDALGGFSHWNFTQEEALNVKMLILMTCTETYGKIRIYHHNGNAAADYDERDVYEGFGRINIGAAIDAVTKQYQSGSYYLGHSPSPGSDSYVDEPQCWARYITLTGGISYRFNMTPPAGADYDLYLYDSETTYGDPGAIASSHSSTKGATESVVFTPASTHKYYVVVKRGPQLSFDFSGNFTIGAQTLEASSTGWQHRYAVGDTDNITQLSALNGGYHYNELYDRDFIQHWNLEPTTDQASSYVYCTADGTTEYDKYWSSEAENWTNPFYSASSFTGTIRAWCKSASSSYQATFRLFYQYQNGSAIVYGSSFTPSNTYALYNLTISSWTGPANAASNDVKWGIEITAGYDERRDIYYSGYCSTEWIDIYFYGWQYVWVAF